MATLITPTPVVMERVSWEAYDRLATELDESVTRMVYDNGFLELMTTSGEHENVKKVTGRLLELWAALEDWPITGWGEVTLRRRDLLVGLEADECYFIQTPVPPAEPGEFDLLTYPPPDLAIEVDISRSSLDKVSIYGRLGIGEVWRWTGDAFVVLIRQDDGRYVESPASRCLPDLPMDALAELVRFAIANGQPAAVRALRDRLRPA